MPEPFQLQVTETSSMQLRSKGGNSQGSPEVSYRTQEQVGAQSPWTWDPDMGGPSPGLAGLPLRHLSSELLSAGWPSRLLRQVEKNGCCQTTALPTNLAPTFHGSDMETRE